jgi:hypothetical protein
MQTITTIGLDIAKSVFQVHGVDAGGQVIVRRQLKRRAGLCEALRQAATTAIQQAEVLAAKRMIERSIERFDLYPARLMGDSITARLRCSVGWSTSTASSPTVFDKSGRQDGTFSRDDFNYDHASDVYVCPSGKLLTTTGSLINAATLRCRGASMIAKLAVQSPGAVLSSRLDTYPARSMKEPVTWRARSRDLGKDGYRDGSARKSRCYSRI